MGENQESIRLLRAIRNMLIGIGLMVSALGLLAFGYLFAEGTNLFTALFLVSALLFLTGTIWWWGSRRLADPVNDPQERS